MSANRKFAPSKASKIITGVLIGLLVLGLIGLAVFLLVPKGADYTEFKVLYNGNALTENNVMRVQKGEKYVFTVTYTYDGEAPEEPLEYSVDIVPYVTEATEFDYTVDGEKMWFSDLASLKAAFSIEQEAEAFALQAPEGITMQEILSSLYEGKTVVVPENITLGKFFTLVISSCDGEVQNRVNFDISDGTSEENPPTPIIPGGDDPVDTVPVESITLDKEAIVW